MKAEIRKGSTNKDKSEDFSAKLVVLKTRFNLE